MANTYRRIRAENRHEWTFTKDGDGEIVNWTSGAAQISTVKDGTVGDGTLRLEWSDDGEAWSNVGEPVTIMASGAQSVSIPTGKIRAFLRGAAIPLGKSAQLLVVGP